jgi:chorismate lyase/3-hydroxybenzoate synthase
MEGGWPRAQWARDLTPTPALPKTPAWVEELVGPARTSNVDKVGGRLLIRSGIDARFCHVQATCDSARAMGMASFERCVIELYLAVFGELDAQAASHPVRFWAFVPGIHDGLGDGLDRYMVFNAGRYAAYSTHFGRPESFDRGVPTASAVGIRGDELVLHCLAANEPGLPVENPRQIPSYRYSRRFGPLPPCFARATLLGATTPEPLLLVGGTASITGEESRHTGELEEQCNETVRNLASLVASAAGAATSEKVEDEGSASLLAAFQDLRIYYTRPADRDPVATYVRARFPSLRRVEMMQASLCRLELMVEIEGLARPGCPAG